MEKTMEARQVEKADLQKAYEGSYYTIFGAGRTPEERDEWINRYEEDLRKSGIGKPSTWFEVCGKDVNRFAAKEGDQVMYADQFQDDLGVLLFPLDGLKRGALAMFKIQCKDRWFDDVVDNMRRRAKEARRNLYNW